MLNTGVDTTYIPPFSVVNVKLSEKWPTPTWFLALTLTTYVAQGSRSEEQCIVD